MIKIIGLRKHEKTFDILFEFDLEGKIHKYWMTSEEFFGLLRPEREKKGEPLSDKEISIILQAFFGKLRKSLKPYPDTIELEKYIEKDLEAL